MKSILTMAVILAAMGAMAEPDFERAPKEPEGMQSLFNNKDLSDWDGDTTLWSVKDGVIRGETTPEVKAAGNTFLICTKANLKDFDLRLTYRLNASNNSGIQYRSKRFESGGNKWIVRGYQHEIRNEVDFPNVSGFIYSEGSIAGEGRLCLCGEKAVRAADGTKTVTATLITNDEYKKLFNLDGWNDVVIVAQGNHLQHYLNGRLILDYTDNSPLALKEGIIALQLHAGKPMWTEYKNVRVKEL